MLKFESLISDLVPLIEEELNKISIKNDFDILIMNNRKIQVFSSDKSLSLAVDKINEMILNNQNNYITF